MRLCRFGQPIGGIGGGEGVVGTEGDGDGDGKMSLLIASFQFWVPRNTDPHLLRRARYTQQLVHHG
jgi:hypothetical protein